MPRTKFFVNVIHQILRLALLLTITGAAAAVAVTASERLDIDKNGTFKRAELRSHVRTQLIRSTRPVQRGATIFEFVLPTASSGPGAITVGPDGNLWFTEVSANRIGRITPTGEITEFPSLALSSGPSDITVGPDGNLWIIEPAGNQIGRILHAGWPRTVVEFPLPTPDSTPGGITVGPDSNLWFTEFSGNKIGRLILSHLKLGRS